MPNRRAARRAASGRTRRGAAGKVVLAALALCLTASGLTWAMWGRPGTRYTAAPKPVSPPAPPALPVQGGFSPASPSKEYVYAGSRLVATEEPAPGPGNLRYVKTGQSGSGSTGYLQWDDTTDNETGFVVESRQCDPDCAPWAQHGQVGQDVTTYNLPPLTSPPTHMFRVKALTPSGPTGYSNEVDIYFMGATCWTEYRNGKKVTVCTGSSSCTPPSTGLIISEFRLRGPAGARDEFVELYNTSTSAITVCAGDGSGGWTLAARAASGASASPVFTVPNGTVIPGRGHYLAVNAGPSGGYSLSNHPAGVGTTAAGDITYTTDIGDNVGIALFKTANPANFIWENRLDAVGSTAEADGIYKEGMGYPPLSGAAYAAGIDYSFYRDNCGKSGSTTTFGTCNRSTPLDTNNNAIDFVFVDTNGTNAGAGQRLGAPGPENLSSPVQRNASFAVNMLDPCVGSTAVPNRVRDFTSDPTQNSTFGTLDLRHTVTNNTGGNVTRLRWRVIDLTTFPVPSGIADLRLRTSAAVVATVDRVPCGSGTSNVTVQGTTLEQPPSQPNGGGFNSSLSSGTVTLATPLAPNASLDVRFLFGIQQTGSYKFMVNIEALP